MLVLAGFAAGCSDPKRATVKGTVLLDKKPLPLAGVVFWPKDDMDLGVYNGKTDEDGRFELTARLQPYVKAGVYKVLIAKDVKTKDGKPPDEKTDDMVLLKQRGALKNILPPRYFDRDNPVFVVEVMPGANDLPPFELTTP
jgi:hypothetical protein